MRIVENANQLDRAFQALADYIVHLQYMPDEEQVAAVLKQHGYQERVQQTRLFRALFHDITDADRVAHKTIGDLFQTLRREIRMDLGRNQGFSTSLDTVIDVFVNGTIHSNRYAADWPVHHPEAPLSGVTQIIVVYEVECDPSRIMWSMRGLKAFLTQAGNTGPGATALRDALSDPEAFGGGFGDDDEVFVDTRQGCRVVDMHLYDVREHYPHADERDWG